MSLKPIISVVMPAYNAEKYIPEAIESVINQTFTDLELVIVDDCSSDATFEIAQGYGEHDSRIRVFQLEKNTGSAYLPRKKAIELSLSEWIVSLDADDFLENNDLKKLYDRQKDTGADVVLHQLVSISENGKDVLSWKCPSSDFDFNVVLSGKEACSLTIGEWVINGNGLFNRKLYEKVFSQSQFENKGMNGDELLTRLLYLSANKVAFCTAKYYYRFNTQSITKQIAEKSFDILDTNWDLYKLVLSHFGMQSSEAKRMALQYFKGVINCSLWLYDKHLLFSKDRKKNLGDRIYEKWRGINWRLVKPQLKYRPFSDLFSLNFTLYKLLIKCWMYVKRIKQKL